ncbi:MAG: UDP-glucose/GDP-mannose dehydrogenase family protein [Methanoregula sp.]|jgi:UDPglucose 6-dehydrogenase|uniref:UDP-glucose dehydrogenase family protein n=1 Tax=Methanoregula sp. TaxID=2052170 RepID=UPI003C13116B
MRISVIGTGYVGSVTGACLAETGYDVIFVDRNKKKLDLIKSGKSPIFEPGLEDLLQKNRKKISVTTDLRDAVANSAITFICVGTPPKRDGSSDLSQVKEVSRTIGKALRSIDRFHVIVTKSTVIPGTNENIVLPILEKESKKKAYADFGIASNPEFLKEGTAVDDFFHADRVVIGTNDPKTQEILETFYKPLNAPVFSTTLRIAEMIKYASNAFLATKISFANEIGNLCKDLGIDSYEVFEGVGLDERINPHFFRSGIGFGGSCFPKDVKALIAYADSKGVPSRILSAVMALNEDQPKRLVALLKKHIRLQGKTIGILGLSFKPDTDDIRESRAIPVIRHLRKAGASVIAYDPMAMENFRQVIPDITYADSASEVLSADAVLIVTEWKEFESLDYHGKLVIDGRRLEKAQKEAAVYEGVCW